MQKTAKISSALNLSAISDDDLFEIDHDVDESIA